MIFYHIQSKVIIYDLTNYIIFDTILSYMTYNNYIKGYLLKKKNIHTLIKKIVEEGTAHAYTLLHIQTNDNQRLTFQNTMEKNILIEHKECGHKYEILFGNFLQNKKVCKVCTATVISGFSAQQSDIKYSQHNTHAK